MLATPFHDIRGYLDAVAGHLQAAKERTDKLPLPLEMGADARKAFLMGRHDVSLYVHYPFCVHKCPYCDFASISSGNDADRDHKYTDMLIKEFKSKVHLLGGRKLISLYIGGGTPSLCKPKEFGRLLETVGPYLSDGAEISLEANPGTVDLNRLCDLKAAGFNRISIGVQSFNEAMLKRLGRIHNQQEAIDACKNAVKAGFENFNLDLMHGLPKQDPAQALDDLKRALELESTHLSWYELTIEEDTAFGKKPPVLPDEDVLYAIEQQGFELLDRAGFEHYEVSGYNLGGKWRCLHNQNYWLYGDYLGIGAAAHQKITLLNPDLIRPAAAAAAAATDVNAANAATAADAADAAVLFADGEALAKAIADEGDGVEAYEIRRSANPENYLEYFDNCVKADMGPKMGTNEYTVVDREEVAFEYMLNRLRLFGDKVGASEYQQRTGMSIKSIASELEHLAQKGLIALDEDYSFVLTEDGKLMLNDAIAEFL